MQPKSAFGRRDAIALGIITSVYAVTAFIGLGDTDAPQSFHDFHSGESVTVDLGEVRSIDGIMLYSGLNTGSYRIELSDDGNNFSDAGSFEQNYVALFKWNDFKLDALQVPNARYIRLTASGDVRLGELAVRCGGELFGQCADAPELFDEQNTVPEYQSYLNSTYFDEIYHARTAYENIEGVYPYEISHPPLGKLIIAIGIELFGMTPFGWRFSGVLFGVLMLPVLYMLLKRMFGIDGHLQPVQRRSLHLTSCTFRRQGLPRSTPTPFSSSCSCTFSCICTSPAAKTRPCAFGAVFRHRGRVQMDLLLCRSRACGHMARPLAAQF